MRSLLARLTAVLLSVGLAACGDASGGAGSTSGGLPARSVPGAATVPTGTAPVGDYVRGDSDEDGDTRDRYDDSGDRGYGREAGPTDRQAVAELVKRYYAAVAAGDGVMACSLTSSSFAKRPDLAEDVYEEYRPRPGTPSLRGASCARVISVLSEQHRQELTAEASTVRVTNVRVRGLHGLALLGFQTAPESLIPIELEHGTWKIDGLLDSEIT